MSVGCCVQFAATKASSGTTAQARVIVVAFNVGGLNGIGEGWRRDGLNASTAIACGSPRSCSLQGPCNTIWLEAANCTEFGRFGIRMVPEASDFSATMASLLFEARVQSVPEGAYPFRMHLPVTDMASWSYQVMDGVITVTAIADAGRSIVTACQGQGCNVTANTPLPRSIESTNGAGSLVVKIDVCDVDGIPILREGESLAVGLTGRTGLAISVAATYDPAAMVYRAEIVGLAVAGEYSLELVSSGLRTDRSRKGTFRVVCAGGYDQDPATEECLPERSACETAGTVPATTSFVQQDVMRMSRLGSATVVELMPLTNTTSFRVSAGQANISFGQPGSFLVRVTTADGRQCTLPQSRTVSCPPGKRADQGQCVPAVEEDPCKSLDIVDSGTSRPLVAKDGPIVFYPGTALSVAPRQGQIDAGWATLVIPTQATEIRAAADTLWLNRTGNFSVRLRYSSLAGAGSSKECSLLSTVVVKCKDGEQEIAGKCYQSLCDQAAVSFALAADPAKGAKSLLQATLQAALNFPAGTTVAVTAAPMNSTVQIPLSVPSGADGRAWNGAATLPATGQWSVGLTIGREQCIAHSTSLSLGCLESFVDDEGRCVCPAGRENVNGRCEPVQTEDPCKLSTIRSSMVGPPVQRGPRGTTPLSLEFGSALLVSVDNSSTAANLRTVLTPTQGAETAAVSKGVGANRVGNFSLQLAYTIGGAEKQCALMSTLIVACKNGQLEVGGKCVQSLCDQAAVSFVLADDLERGARSVIEATLTLPPGVTASVAATPQNSTVPLPLASGVGTDDGNVWTGSVALPTTGAWSLGVTIGREQCIAHSTSLSLGCLESFVDDGRGRCVCPAGQENVNGRCEPVQTEDPCKLASILGAPRQNGSHPVSVKPGTPLSVLLNTTGNLANFSFQTLLIPTQGTEVNEITEDIWLNQTGRFALSLQYSAESSDSAPKQCSLVASLVVECGADEQEIDGECIPRTSCLDANGFWFDVATRQCKKKPLMTVMASYAKLAITVMKTRENPTMTAQADVRLASGDVDPDDESRIVWTARSTATWLKLAKARVSGTLDSDEPAVAVGVTVDATGLDDTFESGPYTSSILIASTMGALQRSDLFEKNSQSLAMVVELSVLGVPYLVSDGATQDVVFQKRDTTLLADGEALSTQDELTIVVNAFDFERRPIRRGELHITWTLIALHADGSAVSATANVTMLYSGSGNVYRTVIKVPEEQEGSPTYQLAVTAFASLQDNSLPTSRVVVSFAVSTSFAQLIIASSLAGVRTTDRLSCREGTRSACRTL